MKSRIQLAVITFLVLGSVFRTALAEGPADEPKADPGSLQVQPPKPIGPPDSALVPAPGPDGSPAAKSPPWSRPRFTERRVERDAMVADIQHRYRPEVDDPRVLAAMRNVPRHLFVPESIRARAYEDSPLPIGRGQTISQPYIVALMTQLAGVDSTMSVLEIGTGSGYQAAVLNELTPHVFTIEIVPKLAQQAAATFKRLGYTSVQAREGDGYAGWPSEAPFDRILVTAAPEMIPEALVEQLAPGGRMVVPVGPRTSGQHLMVVTKSEWGETTSSTIIPVMFVPMVHGQQ